LVIGSIGSGKSHLLKNITTDKKNIAIGRYGQYQKIISANSTLSFQRKETVLAMLWISPPMKSTKKSNVKT
jgi:ABC-type molybdenum transport system ATPase subunit/photorepair protein PhrA